MALDHTLRELLATLDPGYANYLDRQRRRLENEHSEIHELVDEMRDKSQIIASECKDLRDRVYQLEGDVGRAVCFLKRHALQVTNLAGELETRITQVNAFGEAV